MTHLAFSPSTPSAQTRFGVLCGAGAGALWGLVFLAPELAGQFSPLQLTLSRYLFYGLLSALLLAPRLRRLTRTLDRRQWLAVGALALVGNLLYYLLLSSAVQLGGIAMTSLVIGFLPVVVTVIGSRDQGAVPLRRMWLSLLCCALGALCIGWQALAPAAVQGDAAAQRWTGLLCALGALVAWTWFAVSNARWLARVPQLGAHDWSLLTGVVTGLLTVLVLPLSLLLDGGAQHSPQAWLQLAGVGAGLALLASILGNALWNRMSRLLPLTLVGQMILFETLFALLYGFAWEQRWPSVSEALAFACVTASVLSCVAVHRSHRVGA